MKVALVFAVCLVAVFARPEPNGEPRPEDPPRDQPDLQRLVKDLEALLSAGDGNGGRTGATDGGAMREPRPENGQQGDGERPPPPEGETGSTGDQPPPPRDDRTRVLKSLITLLSERSRGGGQSQDGGSGNREGNQRDGDARPEGGCGGGQGDREPQVEGTGEGPAPPAGESQGNQEPPADAPAEPAPSARELEIRALLSLLSQDDTGRGPQPGGEGQGEQQGEGGPGSRPPPPPPPQ